MTVTWCDFCVMEYADKEDEPCYSCSVCGLPYEPFDEEEEEEA